MICAVSRGSVRSGPNAAAPRARLAPRTPVAAPLPTPSWKPQSATTDPSPLDAASRPKTNVCGVETVAGALHVAAATGAAATAGDAAASEAGGAAGGGGGGGGMSRQKGRCGGGWGGGEKKTGGPPVGTPAPRGQDPPPPA